MDPDFFDVNQLADFDISNYITTTGSSTDLISGNISSETDNTPDIASSNGPNSPTELPPEPPKRNLLVNNTHATTYQRGRHSKENCLFITPERLSDILSTDQNKLIHINPLPDFKERSEIKPWLQRIFLPQGVDIVIERSDRNKVVFKCKGTVASTASACPFRIRATYSLKLKKWKIVIMNNTHTHPCQFNPASEEYKKFKNYLRKIGDIDTIKKFEEMEYRAKHELPVVPILISCDCGLTTEINWFDVVLPAPRILNVKKVTKPGRKSRKLPTAAVLTPPSFAGNVESPSCLDLKPVTTAEFDNSSLSLDLYSSDAGGINIGNGCNKDGDSNSNNDNDSSDSLNVIKVGLSPMTVTPTAIDKTYHCDSENEIDFTGMFKELKKHRKSKMTKRARKDTTQTEANLDASSPEYSNSGVQNVQLESSKDQSDTHLDPNCETLACDSNGIGGDFNEDLKMFDDSELSDLLRQFEGSDDSFNTLGYQSSMNTGSTDPFSDFNLFNFCS